MLEMPNKDFYTVPLGQIVHDLAILRITKSKKQFDTEGDILNAYIHNVDMYKTQFKNVYGEEAL